MRLAICAASLVACTPAPEVATARLTLAEIPGCELGESDGLLLRATGDFPMQEQPLEDGVPQAFDAFPPDTRWLVIEALGGHTRAGSLVKLSGRDQDARALILPLGHSCPLGDPTIRAFPGAATAPLPGGGLLIAGGRDSRGMATAIATVLAPGESFARQVPDGMLLRRAGASATVVGTAVVVAGGGPDVNGGGRDEAGPAHDTFEVYDTERNTFDGGQSARLSAGPRRDHGAARLQDGSVLLVGGVPAANGEPLGGAELIELGAGASTTLGAVLNRPRVAPEVLVLGSGTVLIALGRAGYSVDSDPVREVERFDPVADSFETVTLLPARDEGALAALEGDRLLYVGCNRASACDLTWLLPEDDHFIQVQSNAPELIGLDSLRALALRDGRVLVAGRERATPMTRRAFLVDPNTASISTALASRAPERLIALEDGTIAELDEAGASLRREELRSEFDDAHAVPIDDGLATFSPTSARDVALDVATRWEQGESALLALEDARFDVPFLRFADVQIELELEGRVHLLLEPDAFPSFEIAIGAEQVAAWDCRLVPDGNGRILIVRRGTEITLRSTNQEKHCTAPALDGHIGIALRVAAHARVRRLRIERLAF